MTVFTTAHSKSTRDTVAGMFAVAVLVVAPLHILNAQHAPADWPAHSAGNFNPGAALDSSEVTTTH